MCKKKMRFKSDPSGRRYSWTPAGIRRFVSDHSRTPEMARQFLYDLGLRFNSKGECTRVIPL